MAAQGQEHPVHPTSTEVHELQARPGKNIIASVSRRHCCDTRFSHSKLTPDPKII